jgi:hypothetical protein
MSPESPPGVRRAVSGAPGMGGFTPERALAVAGRRGNHLGNMQLEGWEDWPSEGAGDADQNRTPLEK